MFKSFCAPSDVTFMVLAFLKDSQDTSHSLRLGLVLDLQDLLACSHSNLHFVVVDVSRQEA